MQKLQIRQSSNRKVRLKRWADTGPFSLIFHFAYSSILAVFILYFTSIVTGVSAFACNTDASREMSYRAKLVVQIGDHSPKQSRRPSRSYDTLPASKQACEQIRQILAYATNWKLPLVVRSAPNISDAAAVWDEINKRRVIIYNERIFEADATWTRERYVTIFAHEIGHHIKNHLADNRNIVEQELEADEFAGNAAAKLGLKLHVAKAELKALPKVTGGPSIKRRLKHLERGYFLAKNKRVQPTLLPRRIVPRIYVLGYVAAQGQRDPKSWDRLQQNFASFCDNLLSNINLEYKWEISNWCAPDLPYSAKNNEILNPLNLKGFSAYANEYKEFKDEMENIGFDHFLEVKFSPSRLKPNAWTVKWRLIWLTAPTNSSTEKTLQGGAFVVSNFLSNNAKSWEHERETLVENLLKKLEPAGSLAVKPKSVMVSCFSNYGANKDNLKYMIAVLPLRIYSALGNHNKMKRKYKLLTIGRDKAHQFCLENKGHQLYSKMKAELFGFRSTIFIDGSFQSIGVTDNFDIEIKRPDTINRGQNVLFSQPYVIGGLQYLQRDRGKVHNLLSQRIVCSWNDAMAKLSNREIKNSVCK